MNGDRRMKIYFLILYFFTYGILGWMTEVAYAAIMERKFVNRGFLNGPICPIYGVGVSVVLYFLTPLSENLLLLYLASTILVTVLEGLTGYIMDRIFHHKWWDYTNRPFNIGGYVCLLFSLVWGVACVFIVKLLHPGIHKALSWIPVPAGIVLIVILGVALFVDLYVTASAILKLNRRLERMEEIAGELRELSDRMGENIYENVMGTVERSLEGRKKLEEVTSEQKERFEGMTAETRKKLEHRMADLKQRYEEIAVQRGKVSGRLVKAFPKMESRQHKEILEELKARIKDRL